MRRHPGRRELAIFAAGYITYFGVRAVTEGRLDAALSNAAALLEIERVLGIACEGAIQGVVDGSHLLETLANGVYVYGHWPVLIAAGVLLYRYRREHYYTLRNACLLTGLLGLFVFALYPVAPPRLTDLPLMDTYTGGSAAYRQILPPALVNQYAAMPSFHAGWNLAVGIVVFHASRHWALRAFAVAMPIAMAFAVVATANHFVIDVIIGVALVLTAMALQPRIRPRTGRLAARNARSARATRAAARASAASRSVSLSLAQYPTAPAATCTSSYSSRSPTPITTTGPVGDSAASADRAWSVSAPPILSSTSATSNGCRRIVIATDARSLPVIAEVCGSDSNSSRSAPRTMGFGSRMSTRIVSPVLRGE